MDGGGEGEVRNGLGCPETEFQRSCWKLALGPLQDGRVLLTIELLSPALGSYIQEVKLEVS